MPSGYSGNTLSDTATYDNQTFNSLGVTHGTYVWNWGSGANADSFTLNIGTVAVPAPLIGRGLPILLAVGGLLFGAKLLQRNEGHRPNSAERPDEPVNSLVKPLDRPAAALGRSRCYRYFTKCSAATTARITKV